MFPAVFVLLRARQNQQNERRRLILERRLIRMRAQPFALPQNRFIELFRLNKPAAQELIATLTPYLRQSRYRNAINTETKVLAALRFFATGSYQRGIGQGFNLGLSQAVVHRCIHEISEAISEHMTHDFIKFPVERRDINAVKEIFMEKFAFPGVVGAIDCTHVAILKPSREEHNFINRKGYHSINVQIVCDANLKILAINANFPGATHDAFIWRQSAIRRFLLRQYNNGLRATWLIGDSGYPLEPILMIPFQNVEPGTPEERYNIRLTSARNCVERTIGLLKMRFRCLMKERTARYDPVFMSHIVNSCAVLHNICLQHNIYLEEFNNDEPDVNRIEPILQVFDQNYLQIGRNVRNNIVNRYFTQ